MSAELSSRDGAAFSPSKARRGQRPIRPRILLPRPARRSPRDSGRHPPNPHGTTPHAKAETQERSSRHDRHFLGSLTLPIKGCGTRGTVGRPHPRTGTGIRPGWLVPPVSHLLIRMVFAAPDTQPYPSRAHHARALDPLHPAEVDPYCTGGYVKPQRPPRADCRPWVPPARNPFPLANLPIGTGPCLKGYG